MAIIGYIRVSSNKQMLEHQEFEIKKYKKVLDLIVRLWLNIFGLN